MVVTVDVLKDFCAHATVCLGLYLCVSLTSANRANWLATELMFNLLGDGVKMLVPSRLRREQRVCGGMVAGGVFLTVEGRKRVSDSDIVCTRPLGANVGWVRSRSECDSLVVKRSEYRAR